jgi:hypothetical protein
MWVRTDIIFNNARWSPISERTVIIRRIELATSPYRPVASEMRPYPVAIDFYV